MTDQGATGDLYIQKILDGKIPLLGLDINANKIRIRTSKTPSGAGDTGSAGEICWDTSYLYICTATNTWARIGLSW